MDKIKQFWHFILLVENMWSIISMFLQFGAGGFMIAWFLWLFRLLPPWNYVILTLGIIALVSFILSLVRLILAFHHKRKLAEVHEGRTLAPYYISDIKKAKEVWIAWHTATVASSSGELKQNGVGYKITRMLLLSPNGSYLPIHARLMENIGKGDTKSDINRASKRLVGEDVKEIRYVDGLMLSMVICNPNDDKRGWIRIEPWSPFLEAGSRPIFYLNAKQHPISFKNLRDSYDRTWNEVSPNKNNETTKIE